MLGWIRAGYAVLAEATREGQSIAFALVIVFKDGAFYGSGCKDPDTTELNASHMLQWKAILWLKELGLSYYETGAQHFGAQWFHVASEKEIGIAKYKRGFGGITIPVYSGEIFYQAAALQKTLATRFDRLSNAFAAKASADGAA
jgi:lipid II:glycine glycyltransferase (peptidoglycan interpeptide bridge formation enzyme)